MAKSKINYLPFKEAREFVRKLHIDDFEEWKVYCLSGKKPNTIPKFPHYSYRSEWKGYGDWLGNGRDREYLSFEDAQKFTIKLKLKTKDDWILFSRTDNKPNNIPASPDRVYKNYWKDWSFWLTGKSKEDFLPFIKAREIAETSSGWEEHNYAELKKGIASAGFELLGEPRLSSKFIYIDAAKPL